MLLLYEAYLSPKTNDFCEKWALSLGLVLTLFPDFQREKIVEKRKKT